MKGKKGYIQDLLFFGIIIFIFAIILLVAGKLNTDFNTQYQTTNASSTAKDIMSDTSARFDGVFDWLFLTVFILFALSIFVTVFLLDTHPVFFFIMIIVFAIILVVLGIIGNAFDKFDDNSAMSSQIGNMPIVSLIMGNWVTMLLVIGFVMIVLLFSRLRE